MSQFRLNVIVPLSKFAQGTSALCFVPSNRSISTTLAKDGKHWDPKFKALRKAKVIKIKLPDMKSKDASEMTEEERRSMFKKRGILPPRPWQEVQLFMGCTSVNMDEYIPPEGDGKFSIVSKTGAKQKVETVEKKTKSLMAVRKIKSYDETFSTSEFPDQARDVYIKAHEALAQKNGEALRQYVTEHAYLKMRHNTQDKTIHWKFLESLEPARVVHVRCEGQITKENYFAQVTVRFHTQQQLAIYDRFGRLMHGSEILRKDILEYVVFEKHIVNEYGLWRIHSKIIPSWAPPRDEGERTYVPKVSKSKETPEKVKQTAATAPEEVAETVALEQTPPKITEGRPSAS